VAVAGENNIYDETAGSARVRLNSTPNWGFYGSPSSPIETFATGERSFRSTGSGNLGYAANDTEASGREWGFASGTSAAGVGNINQTGVTTRTYLTSSPNWGFYGSPAAPVDVINGGYAVRIHGGDPGLKWNDTNASGRDFGVLSGDSAAGIFNLSDATGGADRTYMNSTPQWGYYGSPGAADGVNFGVQVFSLYGLQINNAIAVLGTKDTGASGHNYEFQSGGVATSGWSIYDRTASATRTQMNTTPQWGFYGSPGQISSQNVSVEDFPGTPFSFSSQKSGDVRHALNDTEASGVGYSFANAQAGVGIQSIIHEGVAARTNLNTTPQWGFYGSPGVGMELFAQQQRTIHSGVTVGAESSDTEASGRAFSFRSGSAAGLQTIYDDTAGADRTQLNSTPDWGFYGTPTFRVDILGTDTANALHGTVNGAGPWADLWVDNQASGKRMGRFASAAGTFSLEDSTQVQAWDMSNTRTGFNGSPTTLVHAFAGQDTYRIQGAGIEGFQARDTSVSGAFTGYEEGRSATGITNITNLNSVVARLQLDGSGNWDFAGSTPATGLGAGGTAFSDLSANLNLKNKNIATGSTSSPTIASSTYAVIPEMTITITTKGNKVLMIFSGNINNNSANGVATAKFAIFKDSSQLTQDYQWDVPQNATFNYVANIVYVDSPSAASHTYDARWHEASVGTTLTALGTARTFEVVELG